MADASQGLEVELPDGRVMPVEITRRPRSRTIRISVDERGGIRVSCPRSTPRREVQVALDERADWIAEHVAQASEWLQTTVVDVASGGPARLLGQWLPIIIEESGRRGGKLDDERLVLSVPWGDDAHEVLLWWYRRHARDVISARVAAWAGLLGHSPKRITIRDQRTRWGSCSSTGTLSFSWRLVLAPLWVMDAIVVHELCHMAELNHSDRFWALVHEAYPRHDEAQQWLRDRGALLQVTRPADAAALAGATGRPTPHHVVPAPAPEAAGADQRGDTADPVPLRLF